MRKSFKSSCYLRMSKGNIVFKAKELKKKHNKNDLAEVSHTSITIVCCTFQFLISINLMSSQIRTTSEILLLNAVLNAMEIATVQVVDQLASMECAKIHVMVLVVCSRFSSTNSYYNILSCRKIQNF